METVELSEETLERIELLADIEVGESAALAAQWVQAAGATYSDYVAIRHRP